MTTALAVTAPRTEGAAPPLRFAVFVPIHTKNKNARENPFVKAKRVKEERQATRLVLDARSLKCPFKPPMVVQLTRLSPVHMDSDNVVGACAHVRDEVAAWLGIDDARDDLVEYRYAREKCARGKFGVRIEIAPRTT